VRLRHSLPAQLTRGCLALALALLAAALWSCGGGSPDGPSVSEWGEAGPGDVMRVVEANGVIRARDKGFVRVGSRLKGQIMKMYVRTGDTVRAGQLLAVLDDRELQDQRAQAVAKVQSARNEVTRVEAQHAKKLEEANAALAADRSRHEYADKLRERRRALHEKGHISGDDLEQARRDSAASGHVVAQDKAVVARIEKEYEHGLERARKAADEAQAMVDQVDALISMTRVESPIDGIVGQVHTQEGEQVVAEVEAVKIVTIIDPRHLELWIYINEADAAGVRPGMPVRFFRPSAASQVLGTVVERVSPAPEMVDKVLYYPAIAPLAPAAAQFLRPEMNVQCYVQVEDLKGVLSVPNRAIVSRGGKRRVFVDTGTGRVKAVEPVFGTRGADRTQVLSGLDPGSRVAVRFAAKEGT